VADNRRASKDSHCAEPSGMQANLLKVLREAILALEKAPSNAVTKGVPRTFASDTCDYDQYAI